MRTVLRARLASLGSTLRSRASMQIEILTLRHQLAVYQRSVMRARIRSADRVTMGSVGSQVTCRV